MNAIRKIIRADGTEEQLERTPPASEVRGLIGAETLDTFTLLDRKHVIFVDDEGHAKGLPVNEKATALYHARCKPGTSHTIVGDVVIVPDADYA
jgi:hypothetical protein